MVVKLQLYSIVHTYFICSLYACIFKFLALLIINFNFGYATCINHKIKYTQVTIILLACNIIYIK
jgi:hypothetical protein